jgi:threonine/homoserine/homoserine lactone efflux protein
VLWLILKGVLIGLGAAAPIGPVNVELARRTLRGGYAAGVALGAGAVSVDVAYALLTTLSVGRFLNRPAVATTLAIGSILILSYLGAMCLRGAMRGGPDALPAAEAPHAGPRARNGYLTGLLMTAVNPLTLAFWFTALPSIAGPIAGDRLPLIAVGVFAGTFAWVLGFAGALSMLGRFAAAVFLRSFGPHL